jgi:DNA-binding GntR family transcriptional regulator
MATTVAGGVESDGALVDRIAATIGSRVLGGQIPSGARLPQEALAEEFGVSRTPVREALRILQASGLVSVLPNRGAVVRRPEAREVREAFAVRAELEGFAAELAAARVQEAQLHGLHEAESRFRQSVEVLVARRSRRSARRPGASELRAWMEANDVFHKGIHEAAGNERLRTTIAELHRSFPRNLTAIVLSETSRVLRENVDQHQGILGAVERGDGAEARRLMVEHIRRSGELVSLRFELAESV